MLSPSVSATVWLSLSLAVFQPTLNLLVHAPELLEEIAHGVMFVDGVRIMEHEWRVAA